MGKLRVCLIGRYPPGKGGTAVANYRLARSLGEKGHEVLVVTDSCTEGSYFEGLSADELRGYEPKNVKVFLAEGSSAQASLVDRSHSLASKAIEVAGNYGIDLIESRYLFPYSLAGFYLKAALGKPHVVRLAGSDITEMAEDNRFRHLASEILKSADVIGCSAKNRTFLPGLGVSEKKVFGDSGFGISHAHFREAKPAELSKLAGRDLKETPVFTSVGKMHRFKGVIELVKAASLIKGLGFFLLFFPESGKDREFVEGLIGRYDLAERALFLPYQPPWRMPSIYKASTCVVCAEHSHPVRSHSPLAAIEALHAGACVLISEETYAKAPFSSYRRNEGVVVVSPACTRKFAEKLREFIESPGKARAIGNAAARAQGGGKTEKLIELYGGLIQGAGAPQPQ